MLVGMHRTHGDSAHPHFFFDNEIIQIMIFGILKYTQRLRFEIHFSYRLGVSCAADTSFCFTKENPPKFLTVNYFF